MHAIAGNKMPERYEKIRDALIESGKPQAEAKRVAAATYNKTRKSGEPPVTRKEPLGMAATKRK